MKRKILVTLLLMALVLPTIVAAQSEEDTTTTTTWTELYEFREQPVAEGQPIDYQFSYNAPFDRALGEINYAVSTAKLLEIMVVAVGPMDGSLEFIADVEILFSDLDQQYSFPNMLSGQQEFIILDILYEDDHTEQASVIMTPKYDPPVDVDEVIGVKLIFYWEVGWKKDIGVGLLEVVFLAGVAFAMLVYCKYRE